VNNGANSLADSPHISSNLSITSIWSEKKLKIGKQRAGHYVIMEIK